MSSDARWIVATGVAVVTVVVGTGALLAGLLLTQIDAVHIRLDRLDDRPRAVEIGFGQIQQRLQTAEQRLLIIERVVLPPPTAPGE